MSSADRRSASVGSADANTIDRGTNQPSSELGKGDFASTLKDPFGTARSPTGEFFSTRTASTSDRHETMDAPSPVFSDSASPPPRRDSSDRRMSKEWDASKVPPSRFQKRAGSIYATSGSRDSHITRKERDSSYHAKLKEKGWGTEKGSGLW